MRAEVRMFGSDRNLFKFISFGQQTGAVPERQKAVIGNARLL